MEVVVTIEATRRAELQSNRHQQTNIQLFTGGMPSPLPNQQFSSIEGKAC